MLRSTLLVQMAAFIALACPSANGQTMGPLLTICRENPCWLANSQGNAVFLTGSHTWANLQERGIAGQSPDFDYAGYLDFLEGHSHYSSIMTLCGYSPLAHDGTRHGSTRPLLPPRRR